MSETTKGPETRRARRCDCDAVARDIACTVCNRLLSSGTSGVVVVGGRCGDTDGAMHVHASCVVDGSGVWNVSGKVVELWKELSAGLSGDERRMANRIIKHALNAEYWSTPPCWIEAAVQMREDGLGFDAIGRKYGVTGVTIRKTLVKFGLHCPRLTPQKPWHGVSWYEKRAKLAGRSKERSVRLSPHGKGRVRVSCEPRLFELEGWMHLDHARHLRAALVEAGVRCVVIKECLS